MSVVSHAIGYGGIGDFFWGPWNDPTIRFFDSFSFIGASMSSSGGGVSDSGGATDSGGAANSGKAQQSKDPCPIESGKQFSGGVSASAATINPFTSGGGGVWGANFQSFDNETHNYNYTYSGSGVGLDVGVSVQAVAAVGSGAWGGPFSSVNFSIGPYAGSVFWSPGKGGWTGVSFGYGVGFPGVAYEKTNYTCKP